MLQVNLPVVDKIHPQSEKFAEGAEHSKLDSSPESNSIIVCMHRLTYVQERGYIVRQYPL